MSNDIKERLRNERRAFATWLNRWTDFDSGEIRAEGIQETIDTLSGALAHIEQQEQRIAELEAENQNLKDGVDSWENATRKWMRWAKAQKEQTNE